jgi:hypothetical protein
VPGTLADTSNVIVDVGTGFYVEKVCLIQQIWRAEADDTAVEGRRGQVLLREGRGIGNESERFGEHCTGQIK